MHGRGGLLYIYIIIHVHSLQSIFKKCIANNLFTCKPAEGKETILDATAEGKETILDATYIISHGMWCKLSFVQH